MDNITTGMFTGTGSLPEDAGYSLGKGKWNMTEIQIPQQVDTIIRILNQNGFEAFAVGGCVRDTLLGREPEDWDITTSAKPEQVKALFHRTVDTGIQHGTVTVLMDRRGYEVTTYRIDGEYEDGRHPKEVAFTSDLKEDLKRRDFTINAMAYSSDTGIIDAFGGVEDLENGIIRCVGDAMERFREDALRILRAIRFSAQLHFWIEDETWRAISLIAPNIANVSKERIQMELTKLLLSVRPKRMKEVYETGISNYVSAAFARIPYERIYIPANLPRKKFVRWAAFLRLVSAEEAVQVMRDLKLDNDTIGKVKTLVKWADTDLDAEPAALRKAMSQMEPEVWDALLEMKNCGEDIRSMTRKIREAGDCLSLKELAVNGQDLIAAGMKPGKEIGIMLGKLLELVLACPEKNDREILLKEIR